MALLSQARAPTRTAYGVYGYASSSAENLSDDNVRRAGEGLNVNVYKNTGAAEPSWGGGVVAGGVAYAGCHFRFCTLGEISQTPSRAW